MTETTDLFATVFAKTALGQQEMASRALGLSPLVRRILVLVDGQRTGAELQVFLVGKGDIASVLTELLEKTCIEPVARRNKAAATLPQPAEPGAAGAPTWAELPPADSRSAQDNEMARNFMINAVNGIIGQHTRLTLIERIFHARGTDELRSAYLAWETAMREHAVASRRLPELREKLFKVL